MVTRAGFLKRMAIAVVASAFFDAVRLPSLSWEKEEPWSLAAAIAKAKPGDTIVVPPGEYEEEWPIIVDKSDLTIIGGQWDSTIHVYHNGPLMMAGEDVERVHVSGLSWSRHV